jgi:hypothetical protein
VPNDPISSTFVYSNGRLTSLRLLNICPCTSTERITFRLHKVMNILELKAFTGTATFVSKASATESIGTGSLSLSTLPTLTQDSLTSCSMTRVSPIQGTITLFTLSFTTPSILLSQALVKVSLPKTQIRKANASTPF